MFMYMYMYMQEQQTSGLNHGLGTPVGEAHSASFLPPAILLHITGELARQAVKLTGSTNPVSPPPQSRLRQLMQSCSFQSAA
jgi:hypothetical protein